jgi:hypothetical protein
MAGMDDAVRVDGRGRAWIDAVGLVASGDFQMASLAERGQWLTDLLAKHPPAPTKKPPRYVSTGAREEVAERYGCSRGGFTLVRCPCGATGWIKWKDQGVRFVALHLDHVHPVCRGGSSDAANLQLLCPACNLRKGARVGT